MNRFLKIVGWFSIVIVILFILLFLFDIGTRTYIDFKDQPSKEDIEQCENEDGEMKRTGLAGAFRCIHTYPDGGKACNSSAECEGSCQSNRNGTGLCDYNDRPFGCFLTIEDDRAGKGMLCVD